MMKKNISSIINIINSLKITDKKIKKELLISNITENDQYGFEFSSTFLKCLSENNFSIVFTGIFILPVLPKTENDTPK